MNNTLTGNGTFACQEISLSKSVIIIKIMSSYDSNR